MIFVAYVWVLESLQQVGLLKEHDQNYLPEQYFMVTRLPGWHHIDVSWNCEAGSALLKPLEA